MADRGESEQTEQLVAMAVQGDGVALNTLFAMHRAYLRRVIDLRLEDDCTTSASLFGQMAFLKWSFFCFLNFARSIKLGIT